MKKKIVVSLLCINVALLAALVLAAGTPRAEAQVYRGGADFLAVSGHIGSDVEATYVLDLGSRRLLGLRFDKTRSQMQPIRGRSLVNDFRRTDEEATRR